MIKICVLAIVSLFFASLLSKNQKEYVFALMLASVLVPGFFGLSQLQGILALLKEFQELTGLSAVNWKILLKILGIAYLTEITCDICNDNGYHALGGQIAICGKLSIISLGIPLILAMIDTIKELFV